jgi:hypothetical protein
MERRDISISKMKEATAWMKRPQFRYSGKAGD